jgi:hypothetical protein
MRSSLAALALALCACTTRDPVTRPFRIRATVGDAPIASLAAGVNGPALIILVGQGHVVGQTTFVVGAAKLPDGTSADVRIDFDDAGAPSVAFPAALDGQPVTLFVLHDPAGRGPSGEPLPLQVLQLATGTEASLLVQQFLLFERAYETPPAEPFVPTGLPTVDTPRFLILRDYGQFEPGKCGPVYYDVLQVYADDVFTLRHGERRSTTMGPAGLPPWTVLHVLSWHRQGTCGGESKSWTQFAAWR